MSQESIAHDARGSCEIRLVTTHAGVLCGAPLLLWALRPVTTTFAVVLLCADNRPAVIGGSALAAFDGPGSVAPAASPRPFRIQVVDDETGWGVPLVELRTVNQIRFVTDSNGIAAFDEPGLFNRKVFFTVKSHGYEFEKDGLGYRGKALEITEGGSARLTIRRLNIARRLYRVTGEGIYRDSVLTGDKVPIREPLLNGQVFGQDSVVNAVYRGKIYWFWGDTNRPDYPLGNFHVPGATSELPDRGGLDPGTGVNLTYFVDDRGFARPTAPMPGEGPTWISGLVVLKDKDGARADVRGLRQSAQDARSLRARAGRVQSGYKPIREGAAVSRGIQIPWGASRWASVLIHGPWRRLCLLRQPLSARPRPG